MGSLRDYFELVEQLDADDIQLSFFERVAELHIERNLGFLSPKF